MRARLLFSWVIVGLLLAVTTAIGTLAPPVLTDAAAAPQTAAANETQLAPASDVAGPVLATVTNPDTGEVCPYPGGDCPQDSTPPVIICPADVTDAVFTQDGSGTDPTVTGTATATDDQPGTPTISRTDTFTATSPTNLALERTFTATDAAGNTATCTQTISGSVELVTYCAAPNDPVTVPITEVPTDADLPGDEIFRGDGTRGTLGPNCEFVSDLGDISVTVTEDIDGDGIGDGGFGGAEVLLFDAAGNLIATTFSSTDGNGLAVFVDLMPGTYRVEVQNLSGVPFDSAQVTVTAGGSANATLVLPD